MGTLFAGIIRAPMTSVFMIFEVTQDYQILVPLMVANLLSLIISKRYQPVPIYHALLLQDGIHLPSLATQAGRTVKTARQVMRTDVPLMPPDSSVEEGWRWAMRHEAPVYLVGTPDHLLGVVTHHQLEEWNSTEKPTEAISGLVKDTFVHGHADHPIDVVLERLGESGGVLPIVSRTEFRRLEGVVTAESLLPVRGRRMHRHAETRPKPSTAEAGHNLFRR